MAFTPVSLPAGSGSQASITGYNPSDLNADILAWTIDPVLCGGTFVWVADQIELFKFGARSAITVGRLRFYITQADSGAGRSYEMALFDSAGTRLATTGDIGASFSSGGLKTVALGSNVSLAKDESFHLAILKMDGTASEGDLAGFGGMSTVMQVGGETVGADFRIGRIAGTSMPASLTYGDKANAAITALPYIALLDPA